MLVTFVSQCEKKALKRTRRILDAFANRIGDNVWQTAITEDGLAMVKQLLRASATKSTAVSCHRVRNRRKTELVWIVGNKRKFNEVGIVPVNRTSSNILHREWENDWVYAGSIQIIATLAALLHDTGKTTIGFQNKLIEGSKTGDPYRHEWVSLKLFELIIQDCDTDRKWLTRLINVKEWLATTDVNKALPSLHPDRPCIGSMPPLAQWVAWLIVTHHRLPPLDSVYYTPKSIERFKNAKRKLDIETDLNQFYRQLQPVDYWVKNPKSFTELSEKQLTRFWAFKDLVLASPLWQKAIKRWANKAINDTTLMMLADAYHQKKMPISNPILLHLSRLCLMVGDHNYSSLSGDDHRRLHVNGTFKSLAANTDRSTHPATIKQSLEEHLLGVASFTTHFARALPIIASELPRLKKHNPLAKPTGNPRFKWQNQAFKIACGLADSTKEHGFFGVNMASTGAGKTIANARIMYALADPEKGARFTIALGLRVLTLQTGLSFRKNLHLDGDKLAILVGGSAHKKLFEMRYDSASKQLTGIQSENETLYESKSFGSESGEDLLDETVDADIDVSDYDALNLGTVIANGKARDLLFAPVVTCTVDHIIQASECKRGGKYIAPLLRLLSSDLILDEPDDFDPADLPALSRLMHLAGLMGTRVMLSSATLTPDLVTGLFEAYQSGRQWFNQSQNKPAPNVVCAWFDEHEKSITSRQCADMADFYHAHTAYSAERAAYLAKQPVRRKAEILPLAINYGKDKERQFYKQLAQTIVSAAGELHTRHHLVCPNQKYKLSVGLIRIAHVKHITAVAQQLLNEDIQVPNDTIIHIVCYHAKQLLLLRNSLENKLDRILNRNDRSTTLFDHDETKQAIHHSPATNHIFMVLATPVAEVGRDHDYDWAIVEPSSMRSIIQLAGRVWRHRPDKIAATPNIMLMQHNLRYFIRLNNQALVFTRPGFETTDIRPVNYDMNHLLTTEELTQLDARPRIIAIPGNIPQERNKTHTLSELEHSVMKTLFHNPQLNYVNAYWDGVANSHCAHTHLQQITPFRAGAPQQDWLLIPRFVNDPPETDYPSAGMDAYYREEVFDKGLSYSNPRNKDVQSIDFTFNHPFIKPWLMTSVEEELRNLQKKERDKSLRSLAITYSSVSLDQITLRNTKGWNFHPFFGFLRQ